MIERFLKQTHFTSEEDYREHLHFIVPENFNFAYDVMDEWAKIAPDKVALLWTSERGEEVKNNLSSVQRRDRSHCCLLPKPWYWAWR